MNAGIPCPVCGKDEFDDFMDFDTCSVCGWKINISQFDDHDLSDGLNPLSVNEGRLELALLQDPATAQRAKELKAEFAEAFRAVRAKFRDGGRLKTGITCGESRAAEVEVRQQYVENLHALERGK